MKAEDIMVKEVITAKADTSIEELARLLTENKISGIPVVDDEGNIIGIVTEGDLLRKEVPPRLPQVITILDAIIYFNGVKRFNEDFKKLTALTASELMTTEVITAPGNMEIRDIARLMVNHNIKRIPVVEKRKIIGIISRADIVRTLITG